MQTRNQLYATSILKQVNTIKEKYSANNDYKKYGAMSHRLPILIRTAGLAQALAFVHSRKKAYYMDLLTDIQAVVTPDLAEGTLLTKVQQVDLTEYLNLTRRVLAALVWYKRYAQSVLNVEDPTDVEEDEV